MASSKKDMRRADLIVPYREPQKSKDETDVTSTMSSTLPMVAIFTRNKLVGWTSVIIALQAWLAETPEQKKTATTPTYFSVGMALMATMVSYMPLFLPPQSGRQGGATTGTGAPPPAPPS
ncbi:hypothetical protein EV356DRAFT_494908 [Viridothelium virens]|uniref:Protein Asterix n=1 Tax=Viridothelium virens TaxID=1048519 RepID=A0A6A6GSN7_VIRVR|nr:hypothetical protein EV356DRAFT_494908 [Viridothelium virens]